jgi:hypothetical protein
VPLNPQSLPSEAQNVQSLVCADGDAGSIKMNAATQSANRKRTDQTFMATTVPNSRNVNEKRWELCEYMGSDANNKGENSGTPQRPAGVLNHLAGSG